MTMPTPQAVTAVGFDPNGGDVPEVTFAVRLRLARRHADLGQQALADILGVSVTTYGNWEAGHRPREDDAICRAVAMATGVNYFWLSTGYVPGEGFRTGNR